MEHRCSLRKPLSMEVVLNYRSLGLVRGRTRNAGMGGMYIETGRIQLPVNAILDLSVILDTTRGARAFQAEAIVVHSDNEGVGIMFSNLGSELHDHLHDMIYTTQVPVRCQSDLRLVS